MLPQKPWKIDQVVWLLAAYFAAEILGMLVVQGYSSALSKEEGTQSVNSLVMLGGTFMFQGLTIIVIGIFLKIHHIGWSEAFGFTSKNVVRTISLAVLASALVLPIALALGWVSRVILETLGKHPELQESVKSLQATQATSQRIYLAIVVIIFAPIMEEMLFRGILYPSIKQLGFPKAAMWITSIFFAAFHLNSMVFLPLLFMALVLILLYETTENLLAPIVTHALFNATNFALLLRQMSQPGN